MARAVVAAPVKFLRETYDELKLVKWPTVKEVTRLTTIVLIISVIVGMYIGALDWIFAKVMELLLK